MIRMPVEMLQISPEADRGYTIYAHFIFEKNDPFAVMLQFPEDNVWGFARELLRLGLETPTGIGDVRISPGWMESAVKIRLSSQDGISTFSVDEQKVRTFLRRTYLLVPAGSEMDRVNLDSEIAKILTS